MYIECCRREQSAFRLVPAIHIRVAFRSKWAPNLAHIYRMAPSFLSAAYASSSVEYVELTPFTIIFLSAV